MHEPDRMSQKQLAVKSANAPRLAHRGKRGSRACAGGGGRLGRRPGQGLRAPGHAGPPLSPRSREPARRWGRRAAAASRSRSRAGAPPS